MLAMIRNAPTVGADHNDLVMRAVRAALCAEEKQHITIDGDGQVSIWPWDTELSIPVKPLSAWLGRYCIPPGPIPRAKDGVYTAQDFARVWEKTLTAAAEAGAFESNTDEGTDEKEGGAEA